MRKIFLLLFIATQINAQQFQIETGFKFNNNFTSYYRDFKPFYYSGFTLDGILRVKNVDYLLGLRYMPYLNTLKPEIGLNYYFNHQPEQLMNYYLHTSFFYNEFSYNNYVNFENYYFSYPSVKPSNYNSVRMRYFIHDIALGAQVGFSSSWMASISAGGGYFISKRDFSEGALFASKILGDYRGFQYNFRFGIRYSIGRQPKKEIEIP
jgi:hypothetical protein